ncbi:hypothetical protein [Flavobacterium aquiphilum]|uniref:hypothetical protein n=1 Tax=Flavobacterium aquiphilum TaxID=3003261 RepID=UPI002480A1B6|nr:hypothetical protein [Flavobacterium aquiphilum]
MSTNHNRIKVADLEKNQPNQILTTNDSGELEFSDINNIKTENYNALDYIAEGKALDARQGKVLKDLIDTINTLLTSDDVNLDTVQELVDAIKTVETSLSTILINDITTGGITKALTAEMGKQLELKKLDVTGSYVYNTYFVDSIVGSNATGQFQNPAKPYLDLAYVMALPDYNINRKIMILNSIKN